MDQPTQVLHLIWREFCQGAARKAPLGGAFGVVGGPGRRARCRRCQSDDARVGYLRARFRAAGLCCLGASVAPGWVLLIGESRVPAADGPAPRPTDLWCCQPRSVGGRGGPEEARQLACTGHDGDVMRLAARAHRAVDVVEPLLRAV